MTARKTAYKEIEYTSLEWEYICNDIAFVLHLSLKSDDIIVPPEIKDRLFEFIDKVRETDSRIEFHYGEGKNDRHNQATRRNSAPTKSPKRPAQ